VGSDAPATRQLIARMHSSEEIERTW
jgi:hypothetical protein